MQLLLEFLKFIFFSFLIVIISKYVLIVVLRKLAEALNLTPKTVGNIAGAATSVPELLTVTFSAVTGFIGTSIYNILSSNIINLIQYLFAVYLNKNQKQFQNMALKIDLILVILTILIPIFALIYKIEFNAALVPAFLLLLILFYYLNHNAHKLYLKNQEKEIEKNIVNEARWIKGKKIRIIKYVSFLFLAAIGLYIIGNFLSKTLVNLCNNFKISELVLGFALGFITSIPELITFFESQKHYKSDSELGVIEATNNLLTSNVSNLFIIQSIGIIIFSIIE